MTHVLYEMFDWPSGNVLGNLLASAIWAIPALAHLHIKLARNHRAVMNRDQVDAAVGRHPAGKGQP